MATMNRVGYKKDKRILLLENSMGASRSHAKRIREYGFEVLTALAELNMMDRIGNTLTKIDLIIINTNKALKELGGEPFLDILNQYEVPVLILSDNIELGQEMTIDRKTSFNIIDHSSCADAIDSTIQRVLKIDRAETSVHSNSEQTNNKLSYPSQSRQFFESSDEAIVFFDASTQRIQDANPAMENLTGIPIYMLIGKNIDQIKFFESLNVGDNLLDEIVAHERVHYENCTAEQAGGNQILVSVDGEIYTSGTRPMIRCTLRQSTREIATKNQLSNELHEKKVMIHELQHRTKNTFAMITGLIELKSLESESGESKQMLRELATRVQSISELYKLLYENDSNDAVNMASYCKVITDSVIGESKDITIKKSLDDITVDTKEATSLGLILVELLYNIIKYAFPYDAKDMIVGIDLTRKKNGFVLTVSDNGVGFPEDYKIEGSSSSGLSLVYLLADQLKGDVEIISNNGTIITVNVGD
jgi:PAS domain S-box-containing protein